MIGTIVEIQDHRDGKPRPAPEQKSSAIRLTIRLNGQGPTREALSQAVTSTRRAVESIGRVVLSGRPDCPERTGPKVGRECELFIVSWSEAEAKAVLELPPPQSQLTLFGDLGQDSLACLLEGLAGISRRGLDPTALPHGFDQAVLRSCLELSEVLNQGFESVRFDSSLGRAILDRGCRDRLRQFLITPPRLERWSLIGRLEALSGRGRLSGLVWDDSGRRWICRFKSEHLPHLTSAWMRCVELTGRAVLEPNRDRILEVESLVVPETCPDPREEEFNPRACSPLDEFEADDLLRLFPPEDGPEEILKNVLLD